MGNKEICQAPLYLGFQVSLSVCSIRRKKKKRKTQRFESHGGRDGRREEQVYRGLGYASRDSGAAFPLQSSKPCSHLHLWLPCSLRCLQRMRCRSCELFFFSPVAPYFLVKLVKNQFLYLIHTFLWLLPSQGLVNFILKK